MPVFAFTVGSLGDFLALGELIVKLGIALYTPGGCTKDYEDLRRELELIFHVLGKINICKGQKMSKAAELCLGMVQIQVAECQKVIQGFLDKRQPTNNGILGKFAWVVKGSGEAKEIRQRLSVHREMLSLLLEMLLSQQLSDVMAICETNTKDMQTIIQQQPKQLTLVDAIGNHKQIPFDFCITYELFTEVLHAYYKHQRLPGHDYVTRGDYRIVLGKENHSLEPAQWSKAVSPDSTLQMSMILRRALMNSTSCPTCGTPFVGSTQNGWADCGKCSVQFQVTFEASETQEIVSPAVSSDMAENERPRSEPNPAVQSRTNTHGVSSTEEEWRKFRLLSIISRSAQEIEYSIFVGGIAADVTNADLMNVFRNPNLGLRGDFPPRLIRPFLSCCNATVVVDSITGIPKGYGFVWFISEADQKRALLNMQGLYCKWRPMRLATALPRTRV